jgi:predicted phage tail protein
MLTGLQQYSGMQQVVRLLGDLGERYGAEHTYYDLRTPADAVKLLCINIPELQEELIHAHEHGIGYRLIQADTDLGYEDLHLPIGSNDLILTPVIVGSGGGGGGIGQILAGVGLIAASFLLPGAGLFGAASVFGATAVAGGFGTAVGTALSAIGASLILGGVSQMLSPQPVVPNVGGLGGANRLSSGDSISTDGPQSITRGTDGRQSYAYTGAANTVGVGATIPVAYGEVLIGSHLLSANVDVTDESDPLTTAIKEPGPDTMLVGGEKLGYSATEASGLRSRRWEYSQVKFSPSVTAQRTLSLSDGNEVRMPDRNGFDNIKADNYQVFFELDRGLFDYVSGAGSSLVDGFITYQIEVITQLDDNPNQVTANVQGTIQGLITSSQPYRWMHYIRYAQFDEKIEEGIQTRVKIVDFRANSSCRLRVINNGYDKFFDFSQNRV